MLGIISFSVSYVIRARDCRADDASDHRGCIQQDLCEHVTHAHRWSCDHAYDFHVRVFLLREYGLRVDDGRDHHGHNQNDHHAILQHARNQGCVYDHDHRDVGVLP